MASPSRTLPSTQELLPQSSNPSSHSLDDDLDSVTGEGQEVSSLSKGQKRSRGGDDTSSDEPPQSRRRSTRNPRIGRGFSNKSDNPIQVAEEETGHAEERAGVPIVALAASQAGSLAPFHGDRIIPNSVCRAETLEELRSLYQIPDAIRLSVPHRGYDVYAPPANQLPIHKAAFECGVRLPLHPLLRRALISLELAPIQISPGFWKHLVGFLVLWKEQCELDGKDIEPGFDELRYVFQVANMAPRGQFYLRVPSDLKLSIPGANVKYAAPWKEEWIVVEGDWGSTALIGGIEYPVPTRFNTQDKWKKGVPSAESRAIIQGIMKRGSVSEEFPSLNPFEGARLEAALGLSDEPSGKWLHFFLFP